MKKIDYRKLCHPAHPEFRLAISPFYLMAHADFDYHEDMSTVLEKHDVNRSMYRIMTVLREHDSANIGFLAERSLMKPNTASRVIERMIAKELVNAFPNPEDSRVTQIVLTQRGRDLLNSLTPIVGRQFQRAIEGVSNEDLEHLVRMLQRISNNLNRLPIEDPGDSPTEKRVGSTRLPAGHAWAASAGGPTGSPAVSLVAVTENRGQGIRLASESPSAALQAGGRSPSPRGQQAGRFIRHRLAGGLLLRLDEEAIAWRAGHRGRVCRPCDKADQTAGGIRRNRAPGRRAGNIDARVLPPGFARYIRRDRHSNRDIILRERVRRAQESPPGVIE
jgi:DNA-binding MarR family transcriptional regulator